MSIDPEDVSAIKGSRGEANLVATCKFCKSSGNADVLLKTLDSYTSQDSERFKTIIQLGTNTCLIFPECRGMEVTEWVLSPGWVCKVEGGNSEFTDMDFSQGEDWADYDEHSSSSLLLSDASTKILK